MIRSTYTRLENSTVNPSQNLHCTVPYIDIASEPSRQAMAGCSTQDTLHFQVYLSDGKYIMEMGSTIIWSQDHKKLTRLISSNGRHLIWHAAI